MFSSSSDDDADYLPDAISVKDHHYHGHVVRCGDFVKDWKCSLHKFQCINGFDEVAVRRNTQVYVCYKYASGQCKEKFAICSPCFALYASEPKGKINEALKTVRLDEAITKFHVF